MPKDKLYYQSLIHQLKYIADIIRNDDEYFPEGRLKYDYLCCIKECMKLCKLKGASVKKGITFNTERNRDLYIDRLYNGMPYQALSDKYGITRERCRQIYIKYKRYVDAGIIKE